MPNILPILRRLGGGRTIVYEVTPEAWPTAEGLDARELYATQANLHAVVSYLADSIAQLPLRTFRRLGENHRERDRESPAARLLWRPNRDQTAYEFINATATEFFLMGVCYWWLLPDSESDSGWQLRIIPREWVTRTEKETNYAPSLLWIRAGGTGEEIAIPRTEFIPFRMYDPGAPGSYQSPIAALRQTLVEQINSERFRARIWKSGGRFNAYITRPKDVQPWAEGQRDAWIKSFRENWAQGGPNEGKIPLLEDGMEIKPYQFNAKDAEWSTAKTLSREDVAAAYHINPALIWPSGSQTYASAKDNARALYAECLGPTLQMLQQRINSFLLPLLGTAPGTYVEFDLREKLKASFEERASVLQSSVGGPWLTRNEARADNDLPPIEGGDELIVPLNVTEGGQASPTDTHRDPTPPAPPGRPSGSDSDTDEDPDEEDKGGCHCCKDAAPEIRIKGRASRDEEEDMAAALAAFFRRQKRSVLPRIGSRPDDWWDGERWDKELADDLEPHMQVISDAHGREAAGILGTSFDPERTRAYLRAMAEGRAHATNTRTRRDLERVLALEELEEGDETPADVMDRRTDVESPMLGRTLATAVAGWALLEGCRQARDQGERRKIEKEWVTGPNPRASHAMMNGQRVPYDAPFSNGAYWPGDDNLSADESCNCNCTTEVIITEV